MAKYRYVTVKIDGKLAKLLQSKGHKVVTTDATSGNVQFEIRIKGKNNQ